MPVNALAKKAVTNFAVKATPSILAHVVGNTLGGGELSKISNSICDTIKDVTCKDRIVLAEAIKAQALMDAPTCDTFMNLLYDAVQVSVRSDCRDVSMILNAVFLDPDATLEEKVRYALALKKQQHEFIIKLARTVVIGVALWRLLGAVSRSMEMAAAQAPKFADAAVEIKKQDAKVKIVKAKHQGKADRVAAKEYRKVKVAEAKQRRKKK